MDSVVLTIFSHYPTYKYIKYLPGLFNLEGFYAQRFEFVMVVVKIYCQI